MKINYPYLTGYLEGVLKTLASDYDFLALKDSESRQNYVQSRIKEAYESMPSDVQIATDDAEPDSSWCS